MADHPGLESLAPQTLPGRAVCLTYPLCRRTARGTRRHPAGSWRAFPLAISCGLDRETPRRGYRLVALLSRGQLAREYNFHVSPPTSTLVNEGCRARNAVVLTSCMQP